jgi:hypothetical protein
LRQAAPKHIFFDEEGKPAFDPDPLERRTLVAIEAIGQLEQRLLKTKIVRPARMIVRRCGSLTRLHPEHVDRVRVLGSVFALSWVL